MFEISVQDAELRERLREIVTRVQSAQPLMEDIARALRNWTEDAFQGERSPWGEPWRDLAESTKRARARRGHWPGRILQVTGGLAASISSQAGADWASIGAAKIYAATHQFGRDAIPARPYLPIDAAGQIPEGLAAEIRALIVDFLQTA